MTPIAPEDRDRYPENWATVIRPALLRRARLRCECAGECGRGHDGRRCPELHLRRPVWSSSPHPVILTIAHLDHTPETADPALLKAMCPVSGGNGACLPEPPADWPEYLEVDDEWSVSRPDPRLEAIDAMVALSVLAIPAESRAGLDAAIALLAEWERWGELVRATVGAALVAARDGGAQANELALYSGLTKPRMYRLIEAGEEAAQAEGAIA